MSGIWDLSSEYPAAGHKITPKIKVGNGASERMEKKLLAKNSIPEIINSERRGVKL